MSALSGAGKWARSPRAQCVRLTGLFHTKTRGPRTMDAQLTVSQRDDAAPIDLSTVTCTLCVCKMHFVKGQTIVVVIFLSTRSEATRRTVAFTIPLLSTKQRMHLICECTQEHAQCHCGLTHPPHVQNAVRFAGVCCECDRSHVVLCWPVRPGGLIIMMMMMSVGSE